VTLYLTPVSYTYICSFQTWLKRRKQRAQVSPEEAVANVS